MAVSSSKPSPRGDMRANAMGLVVVHFADVTIYAALKLPMVALAHGAIAGIYLGVRLALVPLATTAPVRALGLVLGMGALELALFSWQLWLKDPLAIVFGAPALFLT